MKRTFAAILCSLGVACFSLGTARAQSGSALVFDGVNDFANIPLFATNAPTNEITIELWQNVSSAKAQGSFSLSPDNVANRLSAHVPWVDGVVYWDFGNIGGAGRLAYTPPNPIVGSWQHFAFVASSNGNFMRIYRNGVLEAQKTGMTPFVRGALDLNLGQVNGGFFAGQMDEFRIWNVARSSNEIQTNFMRSLTGNEPGLLLYLRCNEGSGTSTADAAALGGNTTAFLSNGVTWAASGASVGGLFVTMADALLIDTNGNGKVNAGDTIRYTVTIQNNSTNTLTNVVLNVPATPNNTLVPGSVKVPPKAVDDGPASNSVPGNAFHVALNTAFNLSAPGLLSNDTLGAPAGSIASFGGGSFAGTAFTTPAGVSIPSSIGTLTVNANGSATFTPSATFNGLATFQYRLTNSLGASIANATIAVGNRPSATSDAYNVTGNTMIDSSLIPLGVLANDAGDLVAISGNTAGVNGTVSISANGHFLFTPNAGFTGADSFTYTITNGFGPVTATVNLTVANKLWYVDNSAPAGTENGLSSSPFRILATLNALNDGGAGHPADNDLIFFRQGSSNYIGSLTPRAGQKIIGDGAPGTFSSLFGFTLAPGSAKAPGVAVPALTGSRPLVLALSGTGIGLAVGNTILGVNVHAANGRGITGASAGSLVISNMTLSAAGDRALSIASGTVNVVLDSVSCTNSADNAVNLSFINGTVTINGGTMLNPVSTAFSVSSGNVNVTCSAAISQANNALLVSVSGAHSGTMTFQTGVLSASNGSGLKFDDADGTYNFNGTTTLNGGGASILITNGSGGDFTFSANTSISNPLGTHAFKVDGGTASVTYNGNITITGTTVTMVNVTNGHATGTITFQTGTLNATLGNGLQFDNADGIYNFLGAVTLNGGDAGIDIQNGSGGNFSFSNAPITNPTGAGFRVNGGGGSIGHSGAISKSSAGQVVDIQGRTGGSVTLNGNLTANTSASGILVQNCTGGTITFAGASKTFSTGANAAVNLASNTGATINFTGGGLAITTTSGAGFNATGGGTVAVTTGANNNTVSTSTGAGVNIVSTTISGSGVTFRSVSASGAASGIVLNNTGVSGGFTVTGDGGAANNGSGGVIASSTGIGVFVTNSFGLNLGYLNIQNSGTDGLRGGLISGGVTLNRCNVTDAPSGGATDDGVELLNISGAVLIQNCLVATPPHNAIVVDNFNVNMASFTMIGNTLTNDATSNPPQNDGLLLVMRGNSVLPFGNIQSNLITGMRAVGVQIQANDSGRIGTNSSTITVTALTAANSIIVQNNTFTKNGQGIDIDSSQISSLTFQAISNTITGKVTAPNAVSSSSSATAINAITAAGADTGPASHTFVGKIEGNFIGTQGVKDSGSGFGNGIRAVVQGQNTQAAITINNNTIREVPNAAIINIIGQNGNATTGTGTARFKITGNTMPAPSGSNLGLCGPANTPCADSGIFVLADEFFPVCTIITGNSIYDVSTMNGSFDIYLAERAGPPAGAQLTVEGTGGNSAYIQANNTLTGAAKFIDEGANTSQVGAGACGTFP